LNVFEVFRGGRRAAVIVVNTMSVAESTDAGSAGGLEEVVVTAQRRAESVQNVGIAISCFRRQPGRQVDQLRQRLAECDAQPAGRAGLRQRPAAISPARSWVHRLYVEQHLAGGRELGRRRLRSADTNRRPVVRHRPRRSTAGPQGTLYGRNTTGGEINFISNRPTADPHAGLTWNTARTMR